MNMDKEFKKIEEFFYNFNEKEFDEILERAGIETIKSSLEYNMQFILNDESVYTCKKDIFKSDLNNNEFSKYDNSDEDYLAS